MIPRLRGYEFAVFSIVCTVAVFLFPAGSGAYSVVHGPVTALLSIRMRLKLWLAMAFASLRLLKSALPVSSTLGDVWLTVQLTGSVTPEQTTILRC